MQDKTCYDMDWIKTQCQKGKVKYLYFWGHRPQSSGNAATSPDHSCLSQWFAASFEAEGQRYATAEHYMMAQKALLFGDVGSFRKIIQATHPKQAKMLGKNVRHFNEKVWQENRRQIVMNGNLAKFSQNPALGDYLRQTGKRVLVEASPVDKIWGAGLAQDDARIGNPHHWRGLNLLGFALMTVRGQLA